MISAAAVMVLPVYYISMMIMDGIDEARGKALEDGAELIKTGVQPAASDNRSRSRSNSSTDCGSNHKMVAPGQLMI